MLQAQGLRVRRDASAALQTQIDAIARHLVNRIGARVREPRRRRYTVFRTDVNEVYEEFIQPRKLLAFTLSRIDALSAELNAKADTAGEFKEDTV